MPTVETDIGRFRFTAHRRSLVPWLAETPTRWPVNVQVAVFALPVRAGSDEDRSSGLRGDDFRRRHWGLKALVPAVPRGDDLFV